MSLACRSGAGRSYVHVGKSGASRIEGTVQLERACARAFRPDRARLYVGFFMRHLAVGEIGVADPTVALQLSNDPDVDCIHIGRISQRNR